MKRFSQRSLLALVVLWSLTACSTTTGSPVSTEPESYEKTLPFREGFSLLQLNDLEWSSFTDIAHQKDYLTHLISWAKATSNSQILDLILLNGNSFSLADKTVVKNLLDCLEAFAVPFAFVWGNDDLQGSYRLADLETALKNCPHAVYANPMDSVTGNSNYEITLRDNGTARYALYAFDSSGYDLSGVPLRYDNACIRADQVAWLERQASYVGPVPSLGFLSLAPLEFSNAYEGRNYNKMVFEKNGAITTPSGNSTLLSRITRLNFKGLFFGQDHANDFVLDLQGLRVGYGVKSGSEKGFATSPTQSYLLGGESKSVQILGGSLYTLSASGDFSLDHLYLQDDGAYTLVKERYQ
jgi:hypothetical protein